MIRARSALRSYSEQLGLCPTTAMAWYSRGVGSKASSQRVGWGRTQGPRSGAPHQCGCCGHYQPRVWSFRVPAGADRCRNRHRNAAADHERACDRRRRISDASCGHDGVTDRDARSAGYGRRDGWEAETWQATQGRAEMKCGRLTAHAFSAIGASSFLNKACSRSRPLVPWDLGRCRTRPRRLQRES